MNKLTQVSIGQEFFRGETYGPINNKFLTPNSVGGLISLFLNISFVVAGIVLLFFFIMGGIGLISSAGQSDPGKVEQSKKTITSAVIGFVIVFISYWIVKLVGQLIGVSDLI